jgi:hypothetical protein
MPTLCHVLELCGRPSSQCIGQCISAAYVRIVPTVRVPSPPPPASTPPPPRPRPCRKRLAKMIATMRERMSAKMGNNNDNAFKMRKLFKMYDKQGTGMVGLRVETSRWPLARQGGCVHAPCWVLPLIVPRTFFF